MHGQVALEIVGVGIGESRPPDDAGVVDDDVDPSELDDCSVDERLTTGDRGHVAGFGDRDSTRPDDLLDDASALVPRRVHRLPSCPRGH